MRRPGTGVLAGATLALGLAGGGIAGAQGVGGATAELRDGSGQVLGTASFSQTADGVLVTGQLRGLTPGLHGVHLHEIGRCEAPFASAGDHWNPTTHAHGVRSPAGPHVGDVYNQSESAVGSNVRAGADGTGALRGLFRGATLRGGAAPLLDADGNALMIHAGEDDNVTDPSGNSGGRIACGVVVAGPAALPRTGAGVSGGTAGAVAGVAAAGGLLGLARLLVRRRR